MSRVLFICLRNAGRSQISEALFNRAAGSRHQARSAGSTPAARVHPEVVAAMRELDIDLATRVPHKLDQADAKWADVVVTLGCGDAARYIPGKRYIDWELPDPAGQPVERVCELKGRNRAPDRRPPDRARPTSRGRAEVRS